MSHVESHCQTPRTWLRHPGSVWVCDCGQAWVMTVDYGFEGWRKWDREKGKADE